MEGSQWVDLHYCR